MLRMRLLQNVFDLKKDFHDDYRAEIQKSSACVWHNGEKLWSFPTPAKSGSEAHGFKPNAGSTGPDHGQRRADFNPIDRSGSWSHRRRFRISFIEIPPRA
jgi:hypothetical protein